MSEKENQVAVDAAALVESGAPLPEGFRAMADEIGGGRLARQLRTAADQMDRGEPLEVALAQSGLPRPIRELLDAAVTSGRPAEVMQELIDLSRIRSEMRRRVLTIFAYPGFVLLVTGCVLLFLGLFLVPAFVDVFDDFEMEMPVATTVVIALMTVWLPWLFGILCALFAATIVIWVFPMPATIERWTYCIPLLGALRRSSRLMRFSRLAALLIEQKRPLEDALRWAGDASGSAHLQRVARRLAKGVEQGVPLDTLVDRERSFPPTVVPSIRWGLESNRLGESFRAVESAFAGRAATQVEYMAALTLPIALLFVASIIPFIAVSLLRPLIEIIKSLT